MAAAERAQAEAFGLKALTVDPDAPGLVVGRPGVLAWGRNSGFQAVNLAVQLGARRIVLVGFDCSLAAGVHWHGRHGRGLSNPTRPGVEKWRDALDRVAGQLAELQIEVFNASAASALRNYPKRPLLEAVTCH